MSFKVVRLQIRGKEAYAVQKTRLCFFKAYVSRCDTNFWWSSEENIYNFCLMSRKEAEQLYNRLTDAKRKKKIVILDSEFK